MSPVLIAKTRKCGMIISSFCNVNELSHSSENTKFWFLKTYEFFWVDDNLPNSNRYPSFSTRAT